MTTIAFNANMKALRQGEYVAGSINENAGEFCLTEESDMTVATLKEIAQTNKIDLTATRKADILAEIIHTLTNERNLPVMSEKPNSEIVKEIVIKGNENGVSDDDMLIEIVKSGIKFSAAMKLFRQAQTDLGLRLTPKDRREHANEILGPDFAPKTPEELQEGIDKVSAHDAIGPQQARATIRRYLKENNREMPKLVATGPRGIRAEIFGMLRKNPTCNATDFADFMKKHGPDDAERRDRLTRYYTAVRELANGIYEDANG